MGLVNFITIHLILILSYKHFQHWDGFLYPLSEFNSYTSEYRNKILNLFFMGGQERKMFIFASGFYLNMLDFFFGVEGVSKSAKLWWWFSLLANLIVKVVQSWLKNVQNMAKALFHENVP